MMDDEFLKSILRTHPWTKSWAKRRILQIARRLEELKEYNREQALFIAADIVKWRLAKILETPLKGTVS